MGLCASRFSPEKAKLHELEQNKPFLRNDFHYLHADFKEIQKAVQDNRADAEVLIADLEHKLIQENAVLEVAFQRFDSNNDGSLQENEVGGLMDYLGFPVDQVDALMSKMDLDADKNVSKEEFTKAVNQLGGSVELFKNRKKQLEGRISFKRSQLDENVLSAGLHQCGISDHEQLMWSVVTSGSDLDAAAKMTDRQKRAIASIRDIAATNHRNALPKLLKKVARLKKKIGGSKSPEIHMRMCLAWIRELSPIIVHIDLDKVGKFLLNDTHYRNQFETKTSGGLLNLGARKQWEAKLFGLAYSNAEPTERPKYGVQNVWNDPRGVLGCKQYGDSYLLLKDVRLRTTLTPEDSGNETVDVSRVATLDYYAHILNKYEDHELEEILRISDGGAEIVGDSDRMDLDWGTYKEAQVHGEIDLAQHVERLVVDTRHKPIKKESLESFTLDHDTRTPCGKCGAALQCGDELLVCFEREYALCPQCSKAPEEDCSEWPQWLQDIQKKHGFKLTWMDDMSTELAKREDGCEMDSEEFETMLSRAFSAKGVKPKLKKSPTGFLSQGKAAKLEAERLALEKAAKLEAEVARLAAGDRFVDVVSAAVEQQEEVDRLALEEAAKAEAERLSAEEAAKAEAARLAAGDRFAAVVSATVSAKAEDERLSAEEALKAEAVAKAEVDLLPAENTNIEAQQEICEAEEEANGEAGEEVTTGSPKKGRKRAAVKKFFKSMFGSQNESKDEIMSQTSTAPLS